MMYIEDEVVSALKNCSLLCVDIEGKDPNLVDFGPGTKRGDGHISGVGFAMKHPNGSMTRSYLSVAHPDTSQREADYNRTVIRDICSSGNEKIGAGITYDAEWLAHENMPLNGKLHDVQYAEPLLNEYARSYSLDSLAKRYDLKPKANHVLDDYCETMGWTGKPITHIWKMPSAVAARYALVDVELPLDIFEKQKKLLEQQKLTELYEMETDLIPVLLEMRNNGVRLDMPLLKRTVMNVTDVHFGLKEEIFDWSGRQINLNSVKQIADVFDKKGIPYPRHNPTPKMLERGVKLGNPNIDKKVLHRLSGRFPICKKILDFRHYETLNNLFLHKYATYHVDGRLYCSFHPLRSDDYGTVSGRFSASKPNLQQVSSKKEAVEDDSGFGELTGKIVRKLFIPEEGMRWAKLDYSQVEYRVMAHYAEGKGSDELRAKYNNDKHTDFHQSIMDLTGFDRGTAKNVNFGGMYGIGQKTASSLFDWTMDESDDFLSGYHRAAPYIKHTRDLVASTVSRRRFLFTLLGRKARIHSTRKLHSMFNRLIQGSAADIMKKSMVDAYKKGLFDTLKLHLTVHDEMDVSYKDNAEGREALKELQHTMETTVKLDVPLLVDVETGENWAEVA